MAGQGFGILLEMWKVTKTVNIRVQPTNGIFPYKIIFEDKHVLTQKEAETKEYDRIAFVSPDEVSLLMVDVHVLGRDSVVTRICSVFVDISGA